MTHHNKSGEEELKKMLGHAIAHGTYMNDEAREREFERIWKAFTAHTTQAIQTALAAVREDLPEDKPFPLPEGTALMEQNWKGYNAALTEVKKTIDEHIKGAGK